MRLSKQGVENIRRGLKRSWEGGAHRQRVQNRMADADTMRKRALYDRKGTEIGTFTLFHSVHRSDQFDLYHEGRLILTGGPRVIADWFSSLKD